MTYPNQHPSHRRSSPNDIDYWRRLPAANRDGISRVVEAAGGCVINGHIGFARSRYRELSIREIGSALEAAGYMHCEDGRYNWT